MTAECPPRIDGFIEGVAHGPSTPLFIADPEDPRATPELFEWKLPHVNAALKGIEINMQTYPLSEALDQDTAWKLQRVLHHVGNIACNMARLHDVDALLAAPNLADNIWFTLKAITERSTRKVRLNNPYHATIQTLADAIDLQRRELAHCPVQLLGNLQVSAPPETVAKACNRPVACSLSFCASDTRVPPPRFELKPDGIVQAVKGNKHGCRLPLVDAMTHTASQD